MINIDTNKDALDYIIDNYYEEINPLLSKGDVIHIDEDLSMYINKYGEDDFIDGDGVKVFFIGKKSLDERVTERANPDDGLTYLEEFGYHDY